LTVLIWAKSIFKICDDGNRARKECIGCGECVEECPGGAITLDEDGLAVVDEEKCTGCKKCTKACPVDAISVE
jgi:ferredoxin